MKLPFLALLFACSASTLFAAGPQFDTNAQFGRRRFGIDPEPPRVITAAEASRLHGVASAEAERPVQGLASTGATTVSNSPLYRPWYSYPPAYYAYRPRYYAPYPNFYRPWYLWPRRYYYRPWYLAPQAYYRPYISPGAVAPPYGYPFNPYSAPAPYLPGPNGAPCAEAAPQEFLPPPAAPSAEDGGIPPSGTQSPTAQSDLN